MFDNTICLEAGKMLFHSRDIRSRSNFIITPPFDKVYCLPCKGMSMTANLSTRFLNCPSRDHILLLDLSREFNIKLNPHMKAMDPHLSIFHPLFLAKNHFYHSQWMVHIILLSLSMYYSFFF
jgi:hypothetical protein